jgi:hypothetical protein
MGMGRKQGLDVLGLLTGGRGEYSLLSSRTQLRAHPRIAPYPFLGPGWLAKKLQMEEVKVLGQRGLKR